MAHFAVGITGAEVLPGTDNALAAANMRELGVQRLIASCLNEACRHIADQRVQYARGRSPVVSSPGKVWQVR